jgi:hypothetical protein
VLLEDVNGGQYAVRYSNANISKIKEVEQGDVRTFEYQVVLRRKWNEHIGRFSYTHDLVGQNVQ